MSTFDPEFYRKFRPYYPPDAFHHFKQSLKKSLFTEPFYVADLGCGTGHSTISLLNTGIQAHVIGVDPDSSMIREAQRLTQQSGHECVFKVGKGEATGLNAESLDAVIIGSAFHWMNPLQTKEELVRILKNQGLIRILEYQFPKAQDYPELNEWIRRQFNLFWKAPHQKPRGSFSELMRVFKSDQRFIQTGSGSPPMIQSLSSQDLLGHLWSQSRVLCYLKTLDEATQERHYQEVFEYLESQFKGQTIHFDFKLQWVEFKKG